MANSKAHKIANGNLLVNLLLALLVVALILGAIWWWSRSRIQQIDIIPQINYAVELKPRISFDQELLKCLQDPKRLTISIDYPTDRSGVAHASSIPIKGSYDYKCSDEKQQKVQTLWYIDLEVSSFSNKLNTTFKGLNTGWHQLRLSVTVGTAKAEKLINFQVVDAHPVVTIISPSAGVVNQNAACSTANSAPCFLVSTQATATDFEDGAISSSKIVWSYNGITLKSGDGNLQIIAPYPYKCGQIPYTLTATVTDSAGKTGSQSVTLTLNAATFCT